MDLEQLLPSFDLQARLCRGMGAEIASRLIECARDDLVAGGVTRALTAGWEGDPATGFLPLRVLAGAHRMALDGRAPDLASHLPTTGGEPRWPAAREVFLDALRAHAEAIRPQLGRFPQTNEVGRAVGLLAGFLRVASSTPQPLRLLEIGSSAGLNLRWDRFHYALGPRRWGDPASDVRLAPDWQGDPPEGPDRIAVSSRAGCDIEPIDTSDPDEAARLCSYVWPDQVERLRRMRAAIGLAGRVPASVERAAAGDWLGKRLAEDARGAATVVFHTSVWVYLPEAEQREIEREIALAGARASESAPLAWVRVEDGRLLPELKVTLFPGGSGRTETLAEIHPHGRSVRWFGRSAPQV